MNTKLLCLILIFSCSFLSTSKPIKGQYHDVMWFLKAEEGLSLTAFWDVKQPTNGWGTRAEHKGEVITLEVANQRVIKRYEQDYKYLTKTYPNLDDWTTKVVAITRYNVGSFGKGMHRALLTNDTKKIAHHMLKYNKVWQKQPNGKRKLKVHSVIDARRKREVRLLTEGSFVTHDLKTRDQVIAHILNSKN